MAELNKKLKGATLVEALVALVIIAGISAMATFIYVNVIEATPSAKQLKAFSILNEISHTSEKELVLIDKEYFSDEWRIQKNVSRYKNSEDLFFVKYTVLDENGKIILEQKQLLTCK